MSAAKVQPPGRIKSAVLRWLGVPIELTNHEFWRAWFGGESFSGEAVSVDAALRLSTVWACVRLLSETIATLPLGFYQRGADGTRTAAPDHPLYQLLHHQPNADMTAVQFWEVVMAALLLWGNAYAEIHRAAGRIIALDFLPPELVGVRRLPSGALEYSYTDRGRRRIIAEADMLHIPAFSIDGIIGLSPISYARNVMGAAISTDRASATVFRKGLMLSGTFETDQIVPKEQRSRFQTRLEEYQGALNAGRAPLLEAGIKYKPISLQPDDAQMLESRAFNVEEICRWFRVPPFMVGHSEKSTSWGTGIEQQMIGFLAFALRPWLTRIEQAIRRSLLTPAERLHYFAEFAVEGLLRADSAARAQYLATMTQNGLMTRNEGRAYDNRPPAPGGDALTVQSNLLPIDQLGQADAGAAVRSALRAWLAADDKPVPDKEPS